MNNTAIITGAAGGIGGELARVIARDGYGLLLIDIHETELIITRQKLRTEFPNLRIEVLVKDLTSLDAAEQIYAFVESSDMQIDILINNAGVGCPGEFLDNDWEIENSLIKLQVDIPTRLIKKFLPAMIERNSGYIMNVSSVVALMPGPFAVVYNASKAYMFSLSVSLAYELMNTGVTLTVLCPGLTDSHLINRDKPAQLQSLYRNRFIACTSGEVAQYGYMAMKKGEVVAIPKFINKLMISLTKILPLKIQANIVNRIRRNFTKRMKASFEQANHDL